MTQPAAAPRDPQQGEAPLHPRVPTPHLHFAARGAAWLERPQPQLVAAVAQEFVAEEYQDEESESASATDPWIVADVHCAGRHECAAGDGSRLRRAPIGPKIQRHTVDARHLRRVFRLDQAERGRQPIRFRRRCRFVRRRADRGRRLRTFPRRSKKAPPAERIAFVEKHTEEMTQQLTSVAHTLAMLEGNEPTEICLEKKEVTLVIRDAENEGDTLDMRVAEALEAKLAKLTPPAAKPELKIAAVPADAVDEVLEQVAVPVESAVH